MPRIRTIKPEFPQSESIGALSREARLLFLQLFTIVDDAGRARAAPRMLASLLYPYDGWLAEIAAAGLLVRYESAGAHYLAITGWLKHQKIDRPTPSRLPPAPGEDDDVSPREASRALAPESDVESESDSGSGPATADVPAHTSGDAFAEFWRAYPRRDGANPRRPAEQKFHALVAAGIAPAVLIAAVKRFAALEATRKAAGTRFIPQAMTWLAQERFSDAAASEPPGTFDIADAVRLYARTGHWSRHAGPEPGLNGCRASADLLARHGLGPDGRRLPDSKTT
jgi:hypothetical protein